MSDVQRLRQELHQVSSDAKQVTEELNGFRSTFSDHVGRVQSLIAGTATGADQQIVRVLVAAASAVDDAVAALEAAADGCRSSAEQV